jgi:hypothetical protein
MERLYQLLCSCYFQLCSPGVAELADAADSKSAGTLSRVGSTPSSGTNESPYKLSLTDHLYDAKTSPQMVV